jgi:hypothetical protein
MGENPGGGPTNTPLSTLEKTTLKNARDRASQRRPARPLRQPTGPLRARPPRFFRLTKAAWGHSLAYLRRACHRGRALLGSRLARGRIYVGLGLLFTAFLAGPSARGCLGAALCGVLALVGARGARLRRALWRGRWGRGLARVMRSGAYVELASRWYGRNGLAAPSEVARRLVGGVLLALLALGLAPDLRALVDVARGAPAPMYSSVPVGGHPLPPLAGAGEWDLTPTRGARLALSLGLGLGAGLLAGRATFTPARALGRLVLRGLAWGLALRALALGRQWLVAKAVGLGGAVWGAWAVLGLSALGLGLAAIALRPLRRGPLRAALEGALMPPRGPRGPLWGLSRAFMGSVGGSCLALLAGLGLGLFVVPICLPPLGGALLPPPGGELPPLGGAEAPTCPPLGGECEADDVGGGPLVGSALLDVAFLIWLCFFL